MKTAVLACKTLRYEVEKIYEENQLDYPITWIESGLHNIPQKLHSCLQEEIDKLQDFDRILMTFGLCGNACLNLTSEKSEIILPKVDDCISLLLGSMERRQEINSSEAMYFFTQGWIEGERNLWVEYEYTIEKYGEKKGKMIFDMMMGNYKTLGLIDTDCYDLDKSIPFCKKIADTLDLKLKVIQGERDYLQRLLIGPWNETEFLIIKPGEKVTNFILEK